uniref:Uncharacterized protein n=1 Tax=Aegilops tauschii subsp. strangulata TaxID=200361 RepID=A0A453AWS4_AEGTS
MEVTGQGRRGGHGGRGGDPERNRRPRWRTTMSPPSSHSLKNSTPLSPMLWFKELFSASSNGGKIMQRGWK